MLLVRWWGSVSLPVFSISFIVSYRKKSIRMALILVSGCCLLISLRISSTHQMLHAVETLLARFPSQPPDVPASSLTSKLHLPSASALQQLPVLDGRGHRWAAVEGPHGYEDLRYAVVGKHGDLVDVVELAVGLAIKAGPQVGHEYLGALEEADGLGAALVHVLVAEAREVLCEGVDEAGC